MSVLQKVWAKSPRRGQATGELLTDHLAATLAAAARLRDRVGSVPGLPDRFWIWVCLAALLHDAGKIPDGFQSMVGNGRGPAKPWGQRHEVYSLGFVAWLLTELPADERMWVALGVATHHRPLTGGTTGRDLFFLYNETDPQEFTERFGTVDQERADELLRWLARTAHASQLLPALPVRLAATDLGKGAHRLFEELRERWEWDTEPAEGRTAVMLQGAVTLADHLSSAHGSLHTRQPLGPGFAKRLGARLMLRAHQIDAAKVDGHLLLRAPTGSGKTEAAQLWATAQAESIRAAVGGQPRVFHTLPYLASINAMADRFGRDLGDRQAVGVAHSRAASYHLARSLGDDVEGSASDVAAARKAVSRAAATRLFREIVRVGTPYQLLRGALAGPAHSSILIDSANSVFILDELHAYDARRLGMVLAMIGFWEEIGGRIGVISATLPTALTNLIRGALTGKIETVEALDHSWPIRHRLTVRTQHLTAQSSVAEIVGRLRSGQAVLVVANNVADARTIFAQLAPIARETHGQKAAALLHSQFRAKDRSAIEQRIRDRFGVGRPRRPGLLVATQVVEVSLDVDFDAIHTSGAPLDALIQRFGRVNRLAERSPADVVVHPPDYRHRRRGGAEVWADGVYEHEPTRLTMDILTRNDGAELDEQRSGEWLDLIYDSDWGRRWRTDVLRHREEFERAFLCFTQPFDDRSHLAESFDELFDGVEAVLTQDIDDYAIALQSGQPAAGRLLGSQYLLPLPHYGRHLGRYNRDLGVLVITADYDPDEGLRKIHPPRGGASYEPGEVL